MSVQPEPVTAPAAPAAPAPAPAPAPSDVLVVPRSSFDFLEGRFRATAKVRMMNVLTAGVATVVVAAVVIAGIAAMLRNSFAQNQLQSLQSEQTVVRRALSKQQSSAAGATQTEVQAHVRERAGQAATVLQNQIDYVMVTQALMALSNVTVENVQFEPLEQPQKDQVATVAVTGSAPDIKSASEATEALSDKGRFPYLTKGAESSNVQCAGDEKDTTCTWAWRGTVTIDARGSRGKSVETGYKVKPLAPPKPQPQMTGTGGK